MSPKTLAFTVLLALGAASPAMAACTPEEVVAKAQEFHQAIMQTAQKDPQKYEEAVTAMRNDLPKLRDADNFDAVCKFYDDWTAKLK